MAGSIMIAALFLAHIATQVFGAYDDKGVGFVGGAMLLTSLGVGIVGFWLDEYRFTVPSLSFFAVGIALMSFGVFPSAVATLVMVVSIALVVRGSYDRDNRPGPWFSSLCMLGPFSGAVLLQYLLATDRPVMSALLLSVLGTAFTAWIAHKSVHVILDDVLLRETTA